MNQFVRESLVDQDRPRRGKKRRGKEEERHSLRNGNFEKLSEERQRLNPGVGIK